MFAAGAMGAVCWFRVRAGRPFRNSIGMVLVRVPAGEFWMGTPPEEREWARRHGAQPDWLKREFDPRRVPIRYPFRLAKTEVTVGQYNIFAEESGYLTHAERGRIPLTWDPTTHGWSKQENRSWRSPGFDQTDRHPATCLTWPDAKAFCVWLTRREQERGWIASNEIYRLPTEEEWEYACRGGTRSRFGWGDDPGEAREYGNVLDSTPRPGGGQWKTRHFPWEDGYPFTAPVGRFRPTAHGLLDMHGNVWEWCENDVLFPSAGSRDRKAMRGGSWDNIEGNLRCGTRRLPMWKYASDTSGFRVALVRKD